MKIIIAIVAMFFAAHARAGTVTIQPGQCVQVGHTNVCASSTSGIITQPYAQQQPTVSGPYYPNQPQNVVVETVQELAPYAYCKLTENKTPNTWDLYRQGGNTRHRMNTLVKSFAHFESEKCQAEADKINQRS